MRLVGEAAADAQGVAYLAVAYGRGEANVVNLGIGAPGRAPGGGDFELTRQVVELGIGREQVGNFDCEGRRVDGLIGSHSGEGAAGDVADYVTAGAFGREADGVECVDYFRKRLDGKPVELDILADSYVGKIAGVFARDFTDDAELAGGHDSVGNADAHHEVVGDEAFAAFAAGGAHTIALGVDAPPLEVGSGPLGHDTGTAFAGELAHFVKGFPGVLLALEAFSTLGLGFLYLNSFSHLFPSPKTKNPRQQWLHRGQ